MHLYKTDKSVISVANNSEKFLNGLTSNDMDKPRSAFLTVHGKIIATFDQVKIDADRYLLAVEKPFVQAVLSHVERYARLSKAVIEIKDYNVYFDLQGDYLPGTNEWAVAQREGQLIITGKNLEADVSDEEFTLFRLKNDIPLHGKDYKDEMLLNVSETEHVSFTKGCFLGQEPVAKVHNRSKPTWKLVVRSEAQCSKEERDKMTSRAVDKNTGEALGFIFVRNTEP